MTQSFAQTTLLAAGLVEQIMSGDPATIFVPTNDAVAGAPEDALNDLLADPERLAEVISAYGAVGLLSAENAMELTSDGQTASIDGMNGGTLMVKQEDGALMVGPSEDKMVAVVTPDIELGNILVHTIDGVFLPE
jgi:uncharacterized surface protein with fasciclin (FAS1) repeats